MRQFSTQILLLLPVLRDLCPSDVSVDVELLSLVCAHIFSPGQSICDAFQTKCSCSKIFTHQNQLELIWYESWTDGLSGWHLRLCEPDCMSVWSCLSLLQNSYVCGILQAYRTILILGTCRPTSVAKMNMSVQIFSLKQGIGPIGRLNFQCFSVPTNHQRTAKLKCEIKQHYLLISDSIEYT